MATQFNNKILAEAAEGMRKEPNDQTLTKVCRALLDTKLLVPATWDKEPVKAEDGKIRFEPDTKISLGLITTKEGQHRYFPVFSSGEQLKNMYSDTVKNTLVLSAKQVFGFLQESNGEVEGLVIDPAGANIPFLTKFLEGVLEAGDSGLKQNTLRKGQMMHLKDPQTKNNALEASLISAGFHEPALKAIYLKERLMDPEKPEDTHWFIVLDSDELDTAIITRVAEIIGKDAGGKEIEFIFTDQKLGLDIARSSKPIYTRM